MKRTYRELAGSSAPSTARMWTTVALLTVVAGATALRVDRFLDYQGLSGDEGYTLALAQRPFLTMFRRFSFEGNGIIYAVLEWPLIRIDQSLLVLRLPALVAGVLAAPALYWAGSKVVSRAAACVAASLLAMSPLAIADSQLARPYVFAMLFGTIAYGCLFRVDGDRRYWAGYVAAMVLAAYSNALALPLLLVAQALFAVADRRRLRRWLLALVPIAVLVVPLAALLVSERSKASPLYWLSRPTPSDATSLASDFLAGRKALVVAVLVVAVALALRRLADRRILVVAAWAIVPPLVLFVGSQIEPAFWPGYLLPALPGVLLLVASAATRLPPAAAATSVALLAAGSLYALFPRNAYHPHGVEAATRALTAERHGDPVVVDISDGLVAAGYYARDLRAADGRLVVSQWKDEPEPQGVIPLQDPGGYGRVPNGPPSRRLIARLLRRTGTVFLFLYATLRQPNILRSSALGWAARTCDMRTTRYGAVQLVSIRRCRAAA